MNNLIKKRISYNHISLTEKINPLSITSFKHLKIIFCSLISKFGKQGKLTIDLDQKLEFLNRFILNNSGQE